MDGRLRNLKLVTKGEGWARAFDTFFVHGQSVCLLIPLLLSLWPVGEASVYAPRNLQIGLIFFGSLFLLTKGHFERFRLPNHAFTIFFASALIACCGNGLLHFWGFKLNGEDFSIFDWMLYNTNYREFMTSPICNMAEPLGVCHHFAIHPTYILLPLAYLHSLFPSPILLILCHAFLVWVGLFPLKRLAQMFFDDPRMVFLVLWSYLANPYTGSLLNHGFHVEVFYVPLGLFFIVNFLLGSPKMWVYGLAFLLVKEDGAFYLTSFAIGQMFDLKFRKQASGLLLLSLGILAINLIVIQPYFLEKNAAFEPSYLRFWGHWGASKPEIIRNLITSPLSVLYAFLTSNWWVLLGSLGFLPLFSFAGLMGLLPGLIMAALANNVHVREFATYYAAPMIPFLFLAFISGTKRLLSMRWQFSWKRAWPPLALLFFGLTGGGYLRYPNVKWSLVSDLKEVRALIAREKPPLVCAQTLLFPHLDYHIPMFPIGEECLKQKGSLTVYLSDARYDSYPLPAHALNSLVENVDGMRLVLSYESSIKVFRTE